MTRLPKQLNSLIVSLIALKQKEEITKRLSNPEIGSHPVKLPVPKFPENESISRGEKRKINGYKIKYDTGTL